MDLLLHAMTVNAIQPSCRVSKMMVSVDDIEAESKELTHKGQSDDEIVPPDRIPCFKPCDDTQQYRYGTEGGQGHEDRNIRWADIGFNSTRHGCLILGRQSLPNGTALLDAGCSLRAEGFIMANTCLIRDCTA